MIHTKFFSLRLMGTAIILWAAITVGCKNNDTNDETTPAADTSSAISSDKPVTADTSMTGMPSATPIDTSAMTGSTIADQKMNAGMGKPNPAKKGMKGKVTIAPAPKLTGTMEADKSGVYSNVEVYPSFPGGSDGLQKYFDENLKYPDRATNDGVEGTVQVMFTVDENGKLTEPHVMGNNIGYGLDEEALRAVKNMPAWKPGKLRGQNVKTKYTLPVTFQLY